MKIPKKYQFEYIKCLPFSLMHYIMKEVKIEISKLILTNEEKQEAIENASFSKVCDLEDLIFIKYVN